MSQTIWGSTARGPAVSTMRIPVDTSSSSTPGYLTIADISSYVTLSPTAPTGAVGAGTLMIGTSAGGYTSTTITAGANITVTNASGSITIAATGGGSSPLTTKGDIYGFSTVNARLPVGTDGQIIVADSTQALGIKWANASAGSGTVNSGTAGQLTYYAGTGTAVSGNANMTVSAGALTLGVTGTTGGSLILSGSATGAISFITQGAAGTWNFNLPITAGSAGQVLTSQGGGSTAMTWATLAGGGNVTGPGSSTNTALARYSGTGGTTLLDSTVIVDGSGNMSGVGTIATAAHAITSNSATAFVVGPNGSVNPAFSINGSVASAVTGLLLTSNAAGNTVTLTATSTAGSEDFTVSSKAAGVMSLDSPNSGGTTVLKVNGSSRYVVSTSAHTFTVTTSATPTTPRFKYTGAANTSMIAGTEFTQILMDMSQTNQHLSNTNITTQRDAIIKGMAHSFVSATGTITDAYALYINPPSAGTNAVITNVWALGLAGNLSVDGNIKLITAGEGIYIKEGSNASMGTATLSGGTVTVSTTKVTANSRIFLAANGGTLTNVGSPYVSSRSAGTSFTISSTNVLDTAVVDWVILEPA